MACRPFQIDHVLASDFQGDGMGLYDNYNRETQEALAQRSNNGSEDGYTGYGHYEGESVSHIPTIDWDKILSRLKLGQNPGRGSKFLSDFLDFGDEYFHLIRLLYERRNARVVKAFHGFFF